MGHGFCRFDVALSRRLLAIIKEEVHSHSATYLDGGVRLLEHGMIAARLEHELATSGDVYGFRHGHFAETIVISGLMQHDHSVG